MGGRVPTSWRKKTILSLFLLSTAHSFAVDKDNPCAALGLLGYDAEKMGALLTGTPVLRRQVLQFMANPAVPIELKRRLQKGLVDQQVEVIATTEEMQRVDLPNFMHKRNPKYRVEPELPGSQEKNQIVEAQTKGDIVVGITQHRDAQHTLTSLLHEAAHVRFETFLEKNLDAIARNSPPGLVREEAPGTYVFNREYLHFLHERYAYGSEHIPTGILSDKPSLNDMTELDVSNRGAIHAGVSDPRVMALIDIPFHQILLGGAKHLPPIEDMIAGIPEGHFFNHFDMQAKRFMRQAARTCKANPEEQSKWKAEALDALDKLVPKGEGGFRRNRLEDELTAAVGYLIGHYEKDPEAQKNLFMLLKDPQVRKWLKDVAKWEVPTDVPLTIQALIHSHPVQKDLAQAARTDPEFYKFYVNGFHDRVDEFLNEQYGTKVPQSHSEDLGALQQEDSFQAWYSAAQFRIQAARFARMDSAWLQKPLADLSSVTENSDFKKLHDGRMPALLALWANLGQRDKFFAEFKTPEAFWNSRESIWEIYLRYTNSN